MYKPVKMFIGYDHIDTALIKAYSVCKYSIKKHSDIEVEPIILPELQKKGYYWRNWHHGKQASDFTYTRFLAPFLKGFYGYAIFCDADFVWNCDPMEMFDFVNPANAVTCVKHPFSPWEPPKGIHLQTNQPRRAYHRKNWGSMMIFNCEHEYCKQLTPKFVNDHHTHPNVLLDLWWAKDAIGNLPHTYNYLVSYYHDIPNPKAIHYTEGGPWWKYAENVEFADVWNNYYNEFIADGVI